MLTMRRSLGLVVGIGTAATALASPVSAATLLQDVFVTSGGQSLNFSEEVTSPARQTGLYAGTAYLDSHTSVDGFRTQVNEPTFGATGFFFPDGFPGTLVTPDRNFNADGSVVTVSADFVTQPGSSGADFVSLKIGAASPQESVNAGTGFSLAIRPWQTSTNNYELYYNGNLLVTANAPAINFSSTANSTNTVELSFSANAFDNAAATVTAKVNGTTIYSNLLATGFTGNYVTIQAADLSGGGNFYGVDNLVISATAIPEPSTLAALAIGGLVVLRRR